MNLEILKHLENKQEEMENEKKNESEIKSKNLVQPTFRNKKTNPLNVKILNSLTFSPERDLIKKLKKNGLLEEEFEEDDETYESVQHFLKNNLIFEVTDDQMNYIFDFLEDQLKENHSFKMFMRYFCSNFLTHKKTKIKKEFFQTEIGAVLFFVFSTILTCKHFEYKEEFNVENIRNKEKIEQFSKIITILNTLKEKNIKSEEHFFVIEDLIFNFIKVIQDEIEEISLLERVFFFDRALNKAVEKEIPSINSSEIKILLCLFFPDFYLNLYQKAKKTKEKFALPIFIDLIPEEYKLNFNEENEYTQYLTEEEQEEYIGEFAENINSKENQSLNHFVFDSKTNLVLTDLLLNCILLKNFPSKEKDNLLSIDLPTVEEKFQAKTCIYITNIIKENFKLDQIFELEAMLYENEKEYHKNNKINESLLLEQMLNYNYILFLLSKNEVIKNDYFEKENNKINKTLNYIQKLRLFMVVFLEFADSISVTETIKEAGKLMDNIKKNNI